MLINAFDGKCIKNIRTFPKLETPFGSDGYLKIPNYATNIRIDIGLSETAHISKYWLDLDPNTYVVCIEPNPDNLMKIICGTGRWIHKLNPASIGERCMLLPYAACNEDVPTKKEFFCTADDPGCSSMHEPVSFAVKRRTLVNTINTGQLISTIDPERFFYIDYIKTDCQGADYSILESLICVAERLSVITFEYEPGQYQGTCKNYEDYLEITKRLGLVEASTENLDRYGLDKHRFLTDDPTFFNPSSISYINQSARYYIQSNQMFAELLSGHIPRT